MGTEPRDYALYLRKSRGRMGIARQRTITTAHIERQGGRVTAEFKDTDRTAFQKVNQARPDRAGFDALIAMLRATPGLGLAAWHADRITRNDEDTRTVMSVCEAGRNLIETARGGTYDVGTPLGRKRLRDDASDAIYEVDHNTERLIAAKVEARAAGLWIGGPRPFGWERDHDAEDEDSGPRMRLREAEAELIREGTRAVTEDGAALAALARAWNASGLTTSRGKVWIPSEVSRVLRRARNAGIAVHEGKEAGPGEWPAIVTETDWRRCKAILESPSRRTTPGPAARYLLAGIATCGVCGTPVIVNRLAGRGRPPRPVYRDRPREGRIEGPACAGSCAHRSCRAARAGGHINRDVASLDIYVSELVIAWVEKHGRRALTPKAPDVSGLEKQLRALEADLAVIDAHARDRSLPTRQLAEWAVPIHAEIAGVKARIAAAGAMAAPSAMFTDDDIRAGWENAGLEAQRALIRALMTVTILPQPRGRPVGHKPGESYFRPEFVRIEWKRGDG